MLTYNRIKIIFALVRTYGLRKTLAAYRESLGDSHDRKS